MTRTQRNSLGVATLLSLVFTPPVLWWIFFGDPTASSLAMDVLSTFIVFHATLFWIYYRNIFRNEDVPDRRRDAWSIAIFLGLAFAQLIYYWKYIWKPPRSGRTT